MKTKRLRENIKKHLDALPSVDNMAKDAIKGKAKKSWYQNANKMLRYYVGRDAKLYSAILASTSPRQTVDKNLEMTEGIYKAFKSGASTESCGKMSILEARRQNVERSMRGKTLSGYKVRAFYKNLTGNYSKVVIDTWMLTYIGLNKGLNKSLYIAYSKRIKETAKKLGWLPCEVQASLWSYCYSQTNKVDIKDVPEFEFQDCLT